MSAGIPFPIPGTAKHRRQLAKGWIAGALCRTGVHRWLLGDRAAVVAFHRVDDRAVDNPISCSRAEFLRYLDFFQRHFRVVSLTRLLDAVERREAVGGWLAITFDDGYRDNYLVAAPELRRRGLPACFFITSDFIGTDTQPWWDEEYGARAAWMTWPQLRELHAQGFEVGAHTASHVDLGAVDEEAAVRELSRSRSALEDALGAPVVLFSYPYGGPRRMSERNRAGVAAAGYRCCFSAYGGTVSAGDDPFLLRRVPITPWLLSPHHFAFDLLFRPPPPALLGA